jgi:hypothetical protein
MTYSLAILNDSECPEPRMIVLIRESGGEKYWTYLSASKRHADSKWLKWTRIRFPEEVTPIERFGVEPVFTLIDGKHVIGVERVGDSSATYRDGVPRKWQGRDGELTGVRPSLVAAIKQWQRARTPSQHSINSISREVGA